jgi:uncharacterized membrane protein YhaH (DUF805 family)
MATKCVLLPLYVFWIVTLLAQDTLQSLVLAVAIVMLFSLSVFTTAYAIHTRREHGRNWFTGLAPKAPSNH